MPFKDPEREREYQREYRMRWRAKNPGKGAAYSRKWYSKNKDKVKEYSRGWRKRRTEGYLLSAARRRAKRLGLSFDLTLSDIVVPTHCPALGIELDRGARNYAPNTPTLDRVNNALGYVRGNVVVVSLRANQLKRDASLAELRLLTQYVEKHHALVAGL